LKKVGGKEEMNLQEVEFGGRSRSTNQSAPRAWLSR
jgi:hypothetical protein